MEVSSEFEPVKLLDQNVVKLDLKESYVEKEACQILVPWLGYAASFRNVAVRGPNMEKPRTSCRP